VYTGFQNGNSGVKSSVQFHFGFQPQIDEPRIQELRALLIGEVELQKHGYLKTRPRFIDEAGSVFLPGALGVGKRDFALVLAEAAIRAGGRAYFNTAHDRVPNLGKASSEARLDRQLRGYQAPKVLIIDQVTTMADDMC
jgi:DNA replication protein DnaC